MTLKYITAALIAWSLPAAAQDAPDEMLAPVDLSTPEAAVHSMMRAMYQVDADMVDQVFATDTNNRCIRHFKAHVTEADPLRLQ